MNEVQGKYNTAKVYTDLVEPECLNQIKDFCDKEYLKGESIRIMPDCHAGAGVSIGFTSTFHKGVDPLTIGVDIGCGMEVINLGKSDIDLKLLDEACKTVIKSGKNVFNEPQENMIGGVSSIKGLLSKVKAPIDVNRALCSVGTLGGGNHFVELDKDDEGNVYLVIHSGSRHLGVEVTNYYSDIAHQVDKKAFDKLKKMLIEDLKSKGKHKEIQDTLKKLVPPVAKGYLTGDNLKDYLHDIEIVQEFASVNRKTMAKFILQYLKVRLTSLGERFETIHNYIDLERKIIRKGSVSAEKGEKLIIPMNMRDGSLICEGKGNADWNYSAPHGAGRIMSRAKAKKTLDVEVFKKEMSSVYSTTVCEETLDESPMSYKPMHSIINNVKDTVTVEKIIKPIYNFKAVE